VDPETSTTDGLSLAEIDSSGEIGVGVGTEVGGVFGVDAGFGVDVWAGSEVAIGESLVSVDGVGFWVGAISAWAPVAASCLTAEEGVGTGESVGIRVGLLVEEGSGVAVEMDGVIEAVAIAWGS